MNADVNMIRSLVKAYPDQVSMKSKDGNLPIHLAARYNVSVEVIKLLLSAYPEGILIKGEFGYLPIHIAARHNARAEVIKLLLSAYPEGISVKDWYGYLPIHLAARNNASVEVINIMLSAYPEGISMKNMRNSYPPLHLAARYNASNEVVKLLLSAYPEGISVKDEDGYLPIHSAACNANVEVINILIAAYPEGLSIRNMVGNLPIHLAVEHNASDEVVKLLLSAYPKGISMKNMRNGYLPLHLAVEHNASDEVVKLLLSAYPEGISMKDRYGYLPIHLAVGNDASVQMFNILLSAYPEGILLRSTRGDFPLHVECKLKCRSAVISKCIELCPKALTKVDENGCLPLHKLLAHKESSTSDALMMIEKYPAALQHQNNHRSLPIDIERWNQRRSSIISKCIQLFPETPMIEGQVRLALEWLLTDVSSTSDTLKMIERDPAALQQQDRFNDLPLHLECRNHCRSAIISKCIQLFPEAPRITDNTGNLPLHMLLEHDKSSIDDAYQSISSLIECYQAALQHKNNDGDLPLHIECKRRCRLSIISKCIELYPDALEVADSSLNLPLHLLLCNELSTVNEFLMMIDKYPAALEHRNDNAQLPIHLECQYQCRSSIILACIELYPDTDCIFTEADEDGNLPLHILLSNKSSTVQDALMMIDKYPAALQERKNDDELPIHLECMNQCRSSIILKCIELYPGTTDAIIGNINQNNFNRFIPALLIIFTANPMSLYNANALIEHDIRTDPCYRRRILNRLPHHVFTPSHDSDYRELNWQPRAAMMMLMSQIQQELNITGILE
jgi:ankyrin repeat protein